MKDILRNTKRKPGLTLIEVIISVALLAILSVPIFITVNTNVKMSQKTELSQQATVIGQRVLEYLGTVNEIELGDDSVLDSIGLQLAFSKDINSDFFVASGKTKQNFDIEVKLRNLIENDDQTSDSTSNELMKQLQFEILEFNNQLVVNREPILGDLILEVTDQSIQFCGEVSLEESSKEVSCVNAKSSVLNVNESTGNVESITIGVNGIVDDTYEVLVDNNTNAHIKVYVQFEANQRKNVKFKKQIGQVDVIYLTKQLDLDFDSEESNVESIVDLYEISVEITSSKVDGFLFKGNTVSNLNIFATGQEGN